VHRDRHRSYAELSSAHREGIDYHVTVERRGSGVAIVAPHGGRIERGTSDVARAIAGDDFDLYLFEGALPTMNFETLHITSTRFDEPRALALIADCDAVLAVHGVADTGERALLGGRDRALVCAMADRLYARGVLAQTSGHRYAGLDPRNLCNRGRQGRGVQIELSDRLRGGRYEKAVIDAVRAALHGRVMTRR
jgi:phage replication-related protein YjqB (UPF0714/DUF867 family)